MTGESTEPLLCPEELEVIPEVSSKGLESLIDIAAHHLARVDELRDGRTQDRLIAEEISRCVNAAAVITMTLDIVLPRPEGWEEVVKFRANKEYLTS